MQILQKENRMVSSDFAFFLDLLPELTLLIDEFDQIHYAGPAVVEMSGYKSSDLLGQSIYQFIPTEESAHLRREFEQVPMLGSKMDIRSGFMHQKNFYLPLQWSVKWMPHQRWLLCIGRQLTPLPKRRPLLDRAIGYSNAPLAPYEKRVLELLLTEASEKQIADRLGLTVSTTHSYVTGVFRKFRVRGRAGLMSLWIHSIE